MKIALFGASGFIGYDFLRLLMERGGATPVVYCTSARNVTNLVRHDLDIRLVPYAQMGALKLDRDIDMIVNFLHPFGNREEFGPEEQTEIFLDFIARAKQQQPKLRLIHLSSFSVYEPFDEGTHFTERDQLAPPKSDDYATSKVLIERRLRALPEAKQWQLHLRPTFVYGPFCKPWTDGLMAAFSQGDLLAKAAAGRMQPLAVRDLSEFMLARVTDFQPGIFNIAGREEVTWETFLKFFEGVVGRGKLVIDPDADLAPKREGIISYVKNNFQDLMRVCVKQKSFNNLVVPISMKFPLRVRNAVHRRLGTSPDQPVRGKGGAKGPTPFMHPFIEEDRLASIDRLLAKFPDWRTSTLAENEELMRKYFAFRFTDGEDEKD